MGTVYNRPRIEEREQPSCSPSTSARGWRRSRKAWLKCALAGAGIEHGINVFLRGRMWDIGADGYTAVVRQGKVLKANHVDGAALVKSWL